MNPSPQPTNQADAVLTSPSIHSGGEGASNAFEMKFLIPASTADEVEFWAGEHLKLDPFADPHRNNAYETTSIYLDTPSFDVLRRSKGFRRRKHRLRRYADEATIYLERKTRRGDRVTKHRSHVEASELARLARSEPHSAWAGDWFHRVVLEHSLRPVCRITYLRTAFMGTSATGTVRLTLDRAVHGTAAEDWTFAPVVGGLPLLEGEVIFELKFRDVMPPDFKQLVERFHLRPQAVSKYRRLMHAAGIRVAGDVTHE